jgi:cytochrome c556
MKRIILSVVVAAGLLASAGAAFSGEAEDKAIKARQALMVLQSFALGNLGAMVKGDVAYDADVAKAYATDLKAIVAVSQTGMWPEGTAMEDDGMKDKTWAKKDAWTTYPEINDKHKALIDATAKMADAAGGGLDALKGAMGDVGGACKACHEKFRAPKE